jgi:predicted metalloprotease with PDZ domain
MLWRGTRTIVVTRKIEVSIRLLGRALLVLGLLTGGTDASAQCHFKNVASAESVTYRFSPEKTPDGMLLKIQMTFRLLAGESAELGIPSASIHDLHPDTAEATIKDGLRGTKTVSSATSGPVSLSYVIRNTWTSPLVSPKQFQPVVLPEYLEVTGDKALVELRKYSDARRVTVNFDWEQLPPTWTLATSFGIAEPLQGRPTMAQRCQSFTGPWVDINHALFAAGDFRLHPFKIGRRSGVLAVRGTWTFSDEQAAAQIGNTIRLVREFWHDDDFPYFLVTLQPFDQDHGSSDGTAYTNAFWMYVSRKETITGLLPLLAHESFHAWNPLKMGPLSMTEFEKIKWFKEGFTEYYAQKLTFEGGEQNTSSFVASLNRDLRAFSSSTSEYVRGRVIALWLDAAIRQESKGKHSLDDVMYGIVHDRQQPMTEQRIFDTIAPYVSRESLVLLKQAAEQQGNLPAPASIPGTEACYTAVHGEFPTLDLGLDYGKSRSSKTITGVKPDGPAYKAGLRDGQAWVASSYDRDDPNQPAIFTISIDGTEKQISYQPLGPVVTAWQYIPTRDQTCSAQGR